MSVQIFKDAPVLQKDVGNQIFRFEKEPQKVGLPVVPVDFCFQFAYDFAPEV